MERILKAEELEKINAYFRAANYLAACELYLKDNPLLKEPLKLEHIKSKLVGHWGTTPGQNFVYVHLNRIIKEHNLNMIYLSGPGHGGGAFYSNIYLEGTYSKVYPEVSYDEYGLKKLFKQFSFPGGTSSHVAPEMPGSINEGGELGYSLAHAYGAVLDNPDLWAACVIGDGEAETGPLAASWQLNKFLNPKNDGVVLPILHLNGYKIANPTILARISKDELTMYFKGMGYEPYFVEYKNDAQIHEDMAYALETIVKRIKEIKEKAKNNDDSSRPMWPMIILKTPKGWTGPKLVDEKVIEGTFRAHQVPAQVDKEHSMNLDILEEWLKSYRPWELFDSNGTLKRGLQDLIPENPMGMNPHANGGELLKELEVPDFKDYMLEINPGITKKSDMMELGNFIRDVVKNNSDNFKIFGPDEALSNRLNHVFLATNRKWNGETIEGDEFLNSDGAVIDSILSEHALEGMLEGYLLTGRHGFIHTYEAFSRVIDSMVSQHAKWLKISKELPWRKDIASLNIILTSHVWQQDHNGYTHQDPGFLNHLVTKKPELVRIYLPIDANTLISCFDHVIKTKNYVNVIVASKHPSLQWLNKEEAIKHCTKGIGVLPFASNDKGNPDVVLASAGDTPNLEVIAASELLRKFIPNIKVRVVNVIDLMKLVSHEEHPHGLTDKEYDELFTIDKPIIFAFHGYPNLIHELTYKRVNNNLHVRGYKEEGAITTPFDMRVLNGIDRYSLVLMALKYSDYDDKNARKLQEYAREMLDKHVKYIKENGIDMPEITEFTLSEEGV
ncbi:MAG: phosphoketolase family protein [Bacilli bacterium]|jgi:xylulose-5-phosphate/fructose-6-phosphate phosphoketolase|nr:phosphoketolase family protein [Bacilli bacterium]